MKCIGHGAIHGFILRIPALVHKVSMCLDIRKVEGEADTVYMVWDKLCLEDPQDHAPNDQSKMVEQYLDNWWDKPCTSRKGGSWWLAGLDHLNLFKEQVCPHFSHLPKVLTFLIEWISTP